eukprot:TRINITY_DN4772_c0_g1_i1.p1 TRINITY_DN4772_c0_g1~~TRINITY_DN4772_c0_g1_i1.p1  ORF type:complete len:266 (-),score=68.89 TRINITY_DN4772_c0_g1_i1:56-853(-)
MSQFKIKGTLGNTTKTVEVTRGSATFAGIKSALESQFPGAAVNQLCYKFKDGSTRALSTDQQLVDAIKDAEKSGAKNFALILYGTGGSTYTAPATSAAPAKPPTPAATSTPASAPASSSAQKPTGPAPVTGSSAPAPAAAGSGAAAASGPHVCHKCQQPIHTAGVQALGKPWHKDCFVCSVCSSKLTGLGASFHEHQGEPYCTTHYRELFAPKCAGCNQALTGMYVNIGGNNYHDTCFNCAKCKSALAGAGYYEKGGQFLCQKCV